LCPGEHGVGGAAKGRHGAQEGGEYLYLRGGGIGAFVLVFVQQVLTSKCVVDALSIGKN